MRGELRIKTKRSSEMVVDKLSIDLPFGMNPMFRLSEPRNHKKKSYYALVENNFLAHLQEYMRSDQKLVLAIERARVAKPGRSTDQSRSFGEN